MNPDAVSTKQLKVTQVCQHCCAPSPCPRCSIGKNTFKGSCIVCHGLTDGIVSLILQLLDHKLTVDAQLSVERKRADEAVEMLKLYRISVKNHSETCRFRKYPDWVDPQDDRCSLCVRNDAFTAKEGRP